MKLQQIQNNYQMALNELNHQAQSGMISQEQYQYNLQHLNNQANQQYELAKRGGAAGAVVPILTSLIPHIPKAIDLVTKGIKGISNLFKKKKHGGMINPHYRIKGVQYSSEVPGQLIKLLTGGRIFLQNTYGGRLSLGGFIGEGIKIYNVREDSRDDSDDDGSEEYDISERDYHGSGLKSLAKLQYLNELHKGGTVIPHDKLEKYYNKVSELLKKSRVK
jgi:hypothetical protein